MPTTLNDLCDRVLAVHNEERGTSALGRLRLRVARHPKSPLPVAFEPMLYFVLQGLKRLTVGTKTVDYRAGSLVVMSIDLPAMSRIVEASPETPYVAVEMVLQPVVVAELLLQLPPGVGRDAAYAIDALPPGMIDPLYRLVGLIREPQAVPILAPMIEREILYRALAEPSGALLRQIVSPDGQLARVADVIAFMRANIAQPLKVETLAQRASMSSTTFHRHFKAVTSLSPVAFHTQLRLQEARRQLLTQSRQVAKVAFAVGYRSVSQFSRDYRKRFGLPPGRDAALEHG